MPSTSSPAAERRARIERLDRLAQALDSKFPLPGTSLRIGWDGIIGLIPGFGDLVTAGPGALMAYEGYRMGARRRALAGIALNTGVDTIIGGVPIFGDIFDVFFKSHRRNIAILKRELARIEASETKEETWRNERDRKTDGARAKTPSSDRKEPSARADAPAARSTGR